MRWVDLFSEQADVVGQDDELFHELFASARLPWSAKASTSQNEHVRKAPSLPDNPSSAEYRKTNGPWDSSRRTASTVASSFSSRGSVIAKQHAEEQAGVELFGLDMANVASFGH